MKATFASHPKSKFWSARNEGNPEDYTLNSHKVCWFDCDKCNNYRHKVFIDLLDPTLKAHEENQVLLC